MKTVYHYNDQKHHRTKICSRSGWHPDQRNHYSSLQQAMVGVLCTSDEKLVEVEQLLFLYFSSVRTEIAKRGYSDQMGNKLVAQED